MRLLSSIGILILILSVVFLCGRKSGEAFQKRDYPITPVPFTEVTIKDQFWRSRIDTNSKVTIPYALEQCEVTGRLKNFRVAGGLEPGTFNSKYPFDDSDVFKIIEGAAFSLHNTPNPQLDNYLDTLISWIAAAQEDDGYLYTYRTILGDSAVEDWAGLHRWEKDHLHSHELYNLGHLYEAAVAHYLATGKSELLEVALKSARLVDKDFGPGAMVSYPGHQEIEMGLVKLYRLTGDTAFLDLAKFFLDSRYGGEEYNQAHKPVTQQTEAVGHAVRAAYMYSGMADVAALTGDPGYIEAIGTIWEDVIRSKLYITGGIGAAGAIEGFGAPYELPNKEAYCETCAGIANVFWNYRLFLLHGDAKYADVMERTLYNNVLAGVSLPGNTFFYANPLQSNGQFQRSKWFACACCPSNICRFIPSVPGYIYAYDEHSVYVNLFISSDVIIPVNHRSVSLSLESQMPWEGKSTIKINSGRNGRFALKIRIPGWVSGQVIPSDLYTFLDHKDSPVTIYVNGKNHPYEVIKGYAVIDKKWMKDDEITVEFPMAVERIIANPLVEADKGKVSLQRGPLVYCAEFADYPDSTVSDIFLSDDITLSPEFRPELLGGITLLKGTDFIAIPYYSWAHRGNGEMVVWFERTAGQ